MPSKSFNSSINSSLSAQFVRLELVTSYWILVWQYHTRLKTRNWLYWGKQDVRQYHNYSEICHLYLVFLYGEIQDLKRNCASTDTYYVSLTGLAPLHLAVIKNQIEMVKVLIRCGADINIQVRELTNREWAWTAGRGIFSFRIRISWTWGFPEPEWIYCKKTTLAII